MARRVTLSAIGVIALAGAATGMMLGRSAIAEINPLHFQGAALHPRDRGAVIDEAVPPLPGISFAGRYGWAEGQAARDAECGKDCSELATRQRDWYARSRSAPVEDGWETAPEPVPALLHEADKPEPKFAQEEVEAEPEFEVERYAHFPVSAEEAEHAASYE